MATLHVRSRFNEKVVRDINKVCSKSDYKIFHCTIQVEPEVENPKGISCSHLC